MSEEKLEKILLEVEKEIEKERREILADSFNVSIFHEDSLFYRDRYFKNEGKRIAIVKIRNELYKLKEGDIE